MIEKIEEKIIHIPEVKLYGIHVRYSMAKQAEGSNPPLWELWKKAEAEGLWDRLRSDRDILWMDAPVGIYYDFNKDNDGCFSYAVGMFCRADASLPEELFCRRFMPSDAACCMFRYPKDEDVWQVNPHGQTDALMKEKGYLPLMPPDDWCAESYHDDLCGDTEDCLGYWIACRKDITD